MVYEFAEVEAQQKAERLATGGRKEVLTDEAERLFLVLYHLKNYPSYDVLGLSFGMDATTAERYVVELLPIVAKTLRKPKCLPARNAEEIARLAQLLGQTDNLLIDTTEIPVERAGKQDEQKGQSNKQKSQVRIVVEHAIAGMKRYKILGDRFRNKSEEFAAVVIGVCDGL